jgi:cell wall-associated NlpC family hydrolase
MTSIEFNPDEVRSTYSGNQSAMQAAKSGLNTANATGLNDPLLEAVLGAHTRKTATLIDGTADSLEKGKTKVTAMETADQTGGGRVGAAAGLVGGAEAKVSSRPPAPQSGLEAGAALGVASAAAQKTDQLARDADGMPYEYGGNGPGSLNPLNANKPSESYDCSGLVSDQYNALTLQPTGQNHATTDVNGTPVAFTTETDLAALGFMPGAMPGAFNIGVLPERGVDGHMASELGGVRAESSNSDGVEYGPSAASIFSFPEQWHLPGTSADFSQPAADAVLRAMDGPAETPAPSSGAGVGLSGGPAETPTPSSGAGVGLSAGGDAGAVPPEPGRPAPTPLSPDARRRSAAGDG